MHEGPRTVNKRILVADDSAEARQALCRLLASEKGLDVCAQAENGQAAIDQAQRHRPDLIILDLAMPVMNGIDAARILKQIMPGTLIILATLHAETALEQLAFGAHVDKVVPKGDARRLIEQTRTLLHVA
jgi:two-component system chemotaxis response regulator CheB